MLPVRPPHRLSSHHGHFCTRPESAQVNAVLGPFSSPTLKFLATLHSKTGRAFQIDVPLLPKCRIRTRLSFVLCSEFSNHKKSEHLVHFCQTGTTLIFCRLELPKLSVTVLDWIIQTISFSIQHQPSFNSSIKSSPL